MPVSNTQRKPADEIQAELGQRVRRLRLHQQIAQSELAEKSGVSERAIRTLEKGAGSSVHTLILILKALGADENMASIAPQATAEHMAGKPAAQRVARDRPGTKDTDKSAGA